MTKAASAVKVIDFGIAKAGDGAALDGDGVVMGTPFYMSSSVDARADVFAS
jgi:hypothetical protein